MSSVTCFINNLPISGLRFSGEHALSKKRPPILFEGLLSQAHKYCVTRHWKVLVKSPQQTSPSEKLLNLLLIPFQLERPAPLRERGKKKSWERIWERKARNLGIWRRSRAASLKHPFLSFALSRLFPFPFLTFSLPLSHIWSVSCVAAWLLAHYGTACVGTERQTSVRFSKIQPRKVQ